MKFHSITKLSALTTLAISAIATTPTAAQNSNVQSVNDPDWVTLRLNVRPGSRYRMTQNTDMKVVVVTAAANRQPSEKTEVSTIDKQVIDYNFLYRNPDGTTQVRITYGISSTRSNVKQNGKVQRPPSESEKLQMSLTGQSIEMKMSPQGQISDVRGLDKVFNKIFSGSGTIAQQREMRDTMKKMFGDDFIKRLSQQLGITFPENPVRIGDSWAQRIETGGAMPLIFNVRRTFQGRENGALTVAEKGTLSIGSAQKAMSMDGANVKMLTTGNYKGTTILDDQTHFMSMATSSLRYGGQVLSSVANQQMTLRLYMTGTTRVVVQKLN